VTCAILVATEGERGGVVEPKRYAWIVPGRLAVAERPGGGGRSHRRGLREVHQAWWRAQGVEMIVSGMRSRHGLAEYEADGFAVQWRPLREPGSAVAELPGLVTAVREALAEERGAVLVHVDYANEWLAAVDAALRLDLGLAPHVEEALEQAAGDGLPVGPLARMLVGAGPGDEAGREPAGRPDAVANPGG
jgi:hypothetical protein